MPNSRALRAFVMTVTAILMLVAGLFTTPAQAVEPATSSVSTAPAGVRVSLAPRGTHWSECLRWQDNDCVERIALQEINQERRQRGLDPLRFDARLDRAAEDHTRHMARTGRYGHSGIGDGTPTERVRRAGFGGYSNEVLGHSYITPSDMVLAWMCCSREDRQMLMKPRMDHIGIAREVSNVSKRPYWTAVVGDVNRR